MPNTTHIRPANNGEEIDAILARLASRPAPQPSPLTASEIANMMREQASMSASMSAFPLLPTEMPASDQWRVSITLDGRPKLHRGLYGAPSIQEAKDEYINKLKDGIKQSFKRINDNMSNIERNKQTIKLVNELVEAEPASQPATRDSNTVETGWEDDDDDDDEF